MVVVLGDWLLPARRRCWLRSKSGIKSPGGSWYAQRRHADNRTAELWSCGTTKGFGTGHGGGGGGIGVLEGLLLMTAIDI